MKKEILLIASIIITVAILFSLLYNPDTTVWSYDEWYDYNWFQYEAQLNTTSPGNYTIFLPVPLASRISSPIKGQPIELMNEISIQSGNVSHAIINTTNGYALKVSGSGPFHLIAEKYIDKTNTTEELDRDYQFSDISLGNETRLVFFNSTLNNSFILTYEISKVRSHALGGDLDRHTLTDWNLTLGWQKVEEETEGWIAG